MWLADCFILTLEEPAMHHCSGFADMIHRPCATREGMNVCVNSPASRIGACAYHLDRTLGPKVFSPIYS